MADDRTPAPRDRPAEEDLEAAPPVLLDVSRLTPDERQDVMRQVAALTGSVEVECPGCGRPGLRRSLGTHLRYCIPAVVRTRRLEVVDGDGAPLVVIGELDGETGIALRDALGRTRTTLALHEGDAFLRLEVEGNQVVNLGADSGEYPDHEPGVRFMLAGFDGIPVRLWRVSPEGEVVESTGGVEGVSDEEMRRIIEETHQRLRPTLERLRTEEERDQAAARQEQGL